MEVFPSQQHNLTASTATKAIAWVCKNQLGIRAARTRAKESERLYEKISENFHHGIAKEKSSIIKVGVLADRQRKRRNIFHVHRKISDKIMQQIPQVALTFDMTSGIITLI